MSLSFIHYLSTLKTCVQHLSTYKHLSTICPHLLITCPYMHIDPLLLTYNYLTPKPKRYCFYNSQLVPFSLNLLGTLVARFTYFITQTKDHPNLPYFHPHGIDYIPIIKNNGTPLCSITILTISTIRCVNWKWQ